MHNNNVCKFPPHIISNDLSVFCFVLETNMDTMRQTMPLTSHRMILVEQGEGDFVFDGLPCHFSAGTLVFGFEGETFSLSSGDDVRYLYINFSGSRGQALCARLGISPASRKLEGMNALIPFCKECLLSTPPENVDLIAESVLLYMFSKFSAKIPPQNSTIQKVITITEKHFREHDLSIAHIAKQIGYSPKYLSHLFCEKMHISYSEYLRSLRLKYAISLFELGISSIKNVSLLSGFSDPLYFSNIFKKNVGVSPTEFIAALSEQAK